MLHCQGEPHVEVGCGFSASDDSARAGSEAARAAVADLGDQPRALVLVFASVRYELDALLAAVVDEVGDAPLVGASTAGEICGGLRQGTVVVMVIASRHLSVRVGLGRDVSQDWRRAVDEALAEIAIEGLGEGESPYWRASRRNGKAAFGLLFSPGNTRSAGSPSYDILEQLKARVRGRIPIVGGSAADDWKLARNYVFYGRRAVSDAMVFAICETQLRFGMGMAHGFTATRRRATVTRAKGHEVLELDGRPAVQAYPALLGRDPRELEGKHVTLQSGQPVGVPYRYGQYSINVASFFTPEGGLLFTQPIGEGITVNLMDAQPERLVRAGTEATRKALLRGAITDPAAVIVFSCALRGRILRERSLEEARRIESLVPGVPTVGFASFGEQGVTDDGVNEHNNAIISVLAIGKQLTQAAEVALENQRLAVEQASTRERLDLALEGARLGMWEWNVQSNEVRHDRRWGQLVGLDGDRREGREEGEGLLQGWSELLHPDDAPRLDAALARHAAGERDVFELEHRLRHHDGRWVWVLARGKLVERDEAKRPLRVLGTSLDITQRKRAEQELRTFAETQAVLVREANHRVKNNLAAVLGMLHLEQSRAPSAGSDRDRDLARRLAGRIEGLAAVHSLLSSIGWRDLPLPLLCERVVHAGLRGIGREVRVEITPCELTVDSNMAHQLALLLIELVTNSAKHAFPLVDSPRIAIDAEQGAGELLITYRDNGPGHPPDVLAGLREARGIGIEIVEGITQTLRGRVSFVNDGGAVTTLAFPHRGSQEEP